MATIKKINDAAEHFRIGVLGGMGPLAGIRLQELIVKYTKAEKDQEHLQVLSFTHPQIPDRTTSLLQNMGQDYISALVDAAKVLENGGATIIIIPCNTAHAKLASIQAQVSVPIFDMVKNTLENIVRVNGAACRVGLLATDGAISAGVFSNTEQGKNIDWILPDDGQQGAVMKTIYNIKRGVLNLDQDFLDVVKSLQNRGALVFLLGCTELSVVISQIQNTFKTIQLVDPLLLAAKALVARAEAHPQYSLVKEGNNLF